MNNRSAFKSPVADMLAVIHLQGKSQPPFKSISILGLGGPLEFVAPLGYVFRESGDSVCVVRETTTAIKNPEFLAMVPRQAMNRRDALETVE